MILGYGNCYFRMYISSTRLELQNFLLFLEFKEGCSEQCVYPSEMNNYICFSFSFSLSISKKPKAYENR